MAISLIREAARSGVVAVQQASDRSKQRAAALRGQRRETEREAIEALGTVRGVADAMADA